MARYTRALRRGRNRAAGRGCRRRRIRCRLGCGCCRRCGCCESGRRRRRVRWCYGMGRGGRIGRCDRVGRGRLRCIGWHGCVRGHRRRHRHRRRPINRRRTLGRHPGIDGQRHVENTSHRGHGLLQRDIGRIDTPGNDAKSTGLSICMCDSNAYGRSPVTEFPMHFLQIFLFCNILKRKIAENILRAYLQRTRFC